MAVASPARVETSNDATAVPRANSLRPFALVLIAIGLLRLIPVVTTSGFHDDFYHYYLGGWMYANGLNAYTEPLSLHCDRLGVEADPCIPFAAHPPLILGMFSLLSTFTPETAYWIWLACQFTIGLLFVEVTRRIVGCSWNDFRWLIVVAIYCNSLCVHKLVYYSQIQLLIATLMYLALAANMRRQHVRACGWITLAAAIKIFPVVLIPWFVFSGYRRLRDWELYRRLATIVVVAGTCVLVSGIGTWHDFVTIGIPNLSNHAMKWANGSIQSFVFFFSDTAIGGSFVESGHAKLAATLASILLLSIAYMAVVFRRPTQRVAFSILLIAATIGGVITWPNYMSMLLLPIALLWFSLATTKSLWKRYIGILAGTLTLMPRLDTLFFATGGETMGHVLLTFYPLYAVIVVAWLLLSSEDREATSTHGYAG